MTQREHPYGSWQSVLEPQSLATASLSIGEVTVDGESIYWLEERPDEGGRGVVMIRANNGAHVDVTPEDKNVRTLVHEYGGASWTVHNRRVFWVELTDQQIHLTDDSGTRRVTNQPGSRFADLTAHPDGSHVLAVREHHPGGGAEPINDIVAIDIESGAVELIFGGTDFASSPRPSQGGAVAFITWSHPNMPWDDTELRVVDWSPGANASEARVLIENEAVQQPIWIGESLIAVTDRTGWWLPHSVDPKTGAATALIDAEVDAALPPWMFGMHTICEWNGELCVMWESDGLGHLGWVRDGHLIELDIEDNDFDSISVTASGSIATASASPTSPRSVSLFHRDGTVDRLHEETPLISGDDVSQAEHITFESCGRTAHALLYRPASANHRGPADERPPLLVLSHGGPTSSARPGFQLSIQFWTNRGFAVVDVNYGGSTGYGREYRELLRDNWGIVDVEDCISAARHLGDAGVVDTNRLAIKGGSAGGYTTLVALAFHDVFAVGASRYGVGDLELLAKDTHKFESRYLDRLVGPYPEAQDIYIARSPIHAIENITAPMIVLQGSEDKVVPPNQAEDLVAALAAQGLRHAYVLFEGEQHGFRKAENIARAVEAEYVFFCDVFGIEPSGDPEPLDIVG
jgi:dipeptidyl aminopeptidase/acylaminoacyl peptidase